jgi:hypothetical protein
MISATLIIALVPILTIHAINETSTNTTTGQPQQASINASFSSGVTIYVVGPQTFIQELIDASIPQSAIRLANVPNLSLIPPGSVVVIDWNYLLNYFSNNASLIIDSLESLFRGEDLIVIAVSNPNESLAASSALAIAWARAYGSKFAMSPAIGGLYVAAFGNNHSLIFTASYSAKGIIGFVSEYESIKGAWAEAAQETEANLNLGIYEDQLSPGTNMLDPCFGSNLQNGTYELAFGYVPMYDGVDLLAYSDGNGSFLYDTCIFIHKNLINASGVLEYAINPAVWFAYIPSNAIIRDGGRIQYFIGTFDHESGWIDYVYHYDKYLGIPINSYTEYIPPSASPSSTYGEASSVHVIQENTGGINNNTWYFYLSGPEMANQQYSVAYEEAAAWVLPQGNETSQTAVLFEEFGVKLLTARLVKFQFLFICYVEYEYKFVWTDFAWVLHYSPKSGISASGLIINQQSPYYVSGITTYSRQGYSLCW